MAGTSKFNVTEEHLKYCATAHQARIVQMRLDGMTVNAIAEVLGNQATNVTKSIKSVVQKAAECGYSPDIDLNWPMPPGQKLKGFTDLVSYDQDGKPTLRHRHIMGRAVSEDGSDKIVEAIESAVQSIKPIAPIKSPRYVRTDLCNLIHVTDYHLAMYAAHEETGADWDATIARDEFVRAITELVFSAPDAGTGIFSQGGDFLHYDSLEAVTPANKHILDADTRAFKMVELALDMHLFAVEEMLKRHRNVIVIIQEGNHDPMSSIWLRKCLKQYFKRNKRVEVMDTEFPYYAYLHGEMMIAFHHGHKKKNKELPALFASEPRYREMWGKAKYCYIHTGHFHQREQDQAEYGGAIVERHPTLAARDAYAARGGWVSWRAMNCITYHKTRGEVSRRTTVPT